MKQYWDNLSPRERYILAGAIVVFLMLLGYLLLIEPFHKETERTRHSVESQRETLQWMRQAALEIRQLRQTGRQAASSGQSLMIIIDASTRQAGIAGAVRQLRPDAQGVSVRLENAAFDDLIRWLGRLNGQHGITVSNFTMERLPDAGRVNANVMLTGGEL